jgi:hypothetical protein
MLVALFTSFTTQLRQFNCYLNCSTLSHFFIFRLKISVFLANPSVPLYVLLMRNRGCIEFETLENQCWSHLRNIKTAMNYFYKYFAHILPIFLIGKIWLNIGICQTLGFSILKMSPLEYSKQMQALSTCIVMVFSLLFKFNFT